MTVDINSWWFFLCGVGGLNILAWTLSARMLYRKQGALTSEAFANRRLLLLLSAGYVAGCAFRSVVPVYDVPRINLFDSWIASVAVGRSVATVAELCFVAQWAILLREISRAHENKIGVAVSFVLVPIIAVAEVFSWSSVLTTANIGHVVEETLWGTSAALLAVGLIAMRSKFSGIARRLLDACCILSISYVAYMFLVDVPLYWSRWVADETAGRHYFSLFDGLRDVASRWKVSYHPEDWKHEIVWMSLYFSVAVWLSILLVHAPEARGQAAQTTGSSSPVASSYFPSRTLRFLRRMFGDSGLFAGMSSPRS